MTNRRKIAYVLPEYRRGIDSHFAYQYELLEKVGRHLDIFLFVEKGDKDVYIDNVDEVRVAKKKGKFSRIMEELKILSEAHDKGYEDIYVHYSFVGAFSAILVSKFKGGRVFYWNCGMPWLYKRGLFVEWLFRFILRNSILVTGTENLLNEYKRHYEIKESRVLPNWINIKKTQLGREADLDFPKDKKIILSIQRLSERKGADKLVPTAKALLEKRDDFLFVVLGKGPYGEKLEIEIKENNLEEYFEVVGSVPQSKVLEYFKSSDLLFLPSEEEGFPHALLESLALGVSFVASEVGGVGDIIPEEAKKFITKDRSPEVFSKLISEELDKPISSEIFRKKAREYDIEKVLPKFISLFK